MLVVQKVDHIMHKTHGLNQEIFDGDHEGLHSQFEQLLQIILVQNVVHIMHKHHF